MQIDRFKDCFSDDICQDRQVERWLDTKNNRQIKQIEYRQMDG